MTQNDVVGTNYHKAAFEILADFFLDDIVQLFAFLLLANHEFFLQLDLEESNNNKTSSSGHIFLRNARRLTAKRFL